MSEASAPVPPLAAERTLRRWNHLGAFAALASFYAPGAAIPTYSVPPSGRTRASRWATVALILSVVGLVTLLAPLCATGLGLGLWARRRIPAGAPGHRAAEAATWIGLVVVALFTAVLLVLGLLVAGSALV